MIRFTPIPTEAARAYQAGAPDANGMAPEHHISDGDGTPCRHCLRVIPKGAGLLLLAYRPFPTPQPYAELGPIFLCSDACTAGGGAEPPEVLDSPAYILRGYSAENRIVSGTGAVVALADVPDQAAHRFADTQVAYVHVRSASNNCFMCRIDRD
jgi:Protein of unknown function (DUF1203)